jgi:peptidoglycan hydrolase-like protein with peptidoglycan-binding domain
MRRSSLPVTGSVLLAGLMSTGVGFAQSKEPVHPDPTGPKGGSSSERTGESDVPLPKGSPASGTVEQGKSGSTDLGTSQSRGNAGMTKPNTSLGGTQSERERESGAPLPAGKVRMGAGQRSNSDVKQAQQALKDKGHDPGPIDGVMGSRTKEAIKSFQSASNLQVTGTLDAETSQKLGISSGSDAMGSRSSLPSESDSMKSRGEMPSDSNTTKGKDTDQQNLPAAK